MTDLSQLTWIVARAGGFLAYGLLTASVVIGLVLGLGWKSRRWTRFVTTEAHRFITLVGLVFVAVHGAALALDPFIGFAPFEILVPGLAHYRPLWVALGIVGGYLALAIWGSGYLRSRIGYAWWRRFHVLAFVAWALATVHGIATGSDTRTVWALAIYGGSTALVLGLLALRLRPCGVLRPMSLLRPAVGGVALVAVVGGAAWTWIGPLQPGWNAIANNGAGTGSARVVAAAPVAGRQTPRPLAAAAFQTQIRATYQVSDDGSSLLIDGVVGGTPGGRFQLLVPAQIGATPTGTLRYQTGSSTTCVGGVTSLRRGAVTASCTDQAGGTWTIGLRLAQSDDGSIVGIIAGQPGSTTL